MRPCRSHLADLQGTRGTEGGVVNPNRPRARHTLEYAQLKLITELVPITDSHLSEAETAVGWLVAVAMRIPAVQAPLHFGIPYLSVLRKRADIVKILKLSTFVFIFFSI